MFQVPLVGYGGASNLSVTVNNRQPPTGPQPSLSLDMTAPDGSLLAGLMIVNKGLRAAYACMYICAGR